MTPLPEFVDCWERVLHLVSDKVASRDVVHSLHLAGYPRQTFADGTDQRHRQVKVTVRTRLDRAPTDQALARPDPPDRGFTDERHDHLLSAGLEAQVWVVNPK